MKVFAFLLLILGCSLVNGGQLLAVQKFGSGYPSFHIIERNGDGSLSCGTYKCRNPPFYCKIESKSDDSLQNLISTIECKNANMQATDRWTLNQRSPKPGIKLNIMTESDIYQNINNKKNLEVGNGDGQQNMFEAMGMQNPFLAMNSNGFFHDEDKNDGNDDNDDDE